MILCSGHDEAQVLIGDYPERSQAFLHMPYQKVELQVGESDGELSWVGMNGQ